MHLALEDAPTGQTLKLYLAVIFSITLFSCTHRGSVAFAESITGGAVNRGQHLIYSYNCGSCHVIPGIAEARGTIGPPLGGFGSRSYIAGVLINTPENLSRWVRNPQQIQAGNAMPNLGVTQEQAADIAAYLYTLQ